MSVDPQDASNETPVSDTPLCEPDTQTSSVYTPEPNKNRWQPLAQILGKIKEKKIIRKNHIAKQSWKRHNKTTTNTTNNHLPIQHKAMSGKIKQIIKSQCRWPIFHSTVSDSYYESARKRDEERQRKQKEYIAKCLEQEEEKKNYTRIKFIYKDKEETTNNNDTDKRKYRGIQVSGNPSDLSSYNVSNEPVEVPKYVPENEINFQVQETPEPFYELEILREITPWNLPERKSKYHAIDSLTALQHSEDSNLKPMIQYWNSLRNTRSNSVLLNSHSKESPLKPKEVNLVEVLSSAINEASNNKEITIDEIIHKIRDDYETKAGISRTTQTIYLLNFEDDTVRPVFYVDDCYMLEVKNFYNQANLLLDIETLTIELNSNYEKEELYPIMFRDFECDKKDMFVNVYIPQILSVLSSAWNVKTIHTNIFGTTIPLMKNLGNIQKDAASLLEYKKNIISEQLQGFVIPEDMEQFIKEQNEARERAKQERKQQKENLSDLHSWFRDDEQSYSSYNWEYDVLASKSFSAFEKVEWYKKSDESSDDELTVNSSLQCPTEFLPLPASDRGGLNFKDKSVPGTVSTKDKNEKDLVVLVDTKTLKTIVLINPSKTAKAVYTDYPEFGFILLFEVTTSSLAIQKHIEETYNKHIFTDVEEINAMVSSTGKYLVFANKNEEIASMDEANSVKKFFETYYLIDNEPEHRIKAQELCDIVSGSNMVYATIKRTGFRNRLSNYLKEIGLQKKRYNDGYYYYGLVRNSCYMPDSLRRRYEVISNRTKEEEDALTKIRERYYSLNNFDELCEKLKREPIHKIVASLKKEATNDDFYCEDGTFKNICKELMDLTYESGLDIEAIKRTRSNLTGIVPTLTKEVRCFLVAIMHNLDKIIKEKDGYPADDPRYKYAWKCIVESY